jgi:hypothetical protein
VGGIELEEGTHAALHPPHALLFDEAETLEFSELQLHNLRIQAKPLGSLASGEGLPGFEQAQALHPDGGKRRAARQPFARGEKRQN